MGKYMTPNYSVVIFTTFRVDFEKHLEYYALHRPKELVESFGIN